jgi:transcriptional regulator GlxA family with amidase domain
MLLHLGADSGRPGSLDISDPLIAKLTREVRETPGQRRSVQELAEQAGLSRSQLTRRFTRATGLSPEAFLIHARIDRSRYLLRETPMPVAAIAQSLGYCDTFYFCRQFKAITHQTPSRFRAGRGTK